MVGDLNISERQNISTLDYLSHSHTHTHIAGYSNWFE